MRICDPHPFKFWLQPSNGGSYHQAIKWLDLKPRGIELSDDGALSDDDGDQVKSILYEWAEEDIGFCSHKCGYEVLDPDSGEVAASLLELREYTIERLKEAQEIVHQVHEKIKKYPPDTIKTAEFIRGESLQGLCEDSIPNVVFNAVYDKEMDLFKKRRETDIADESAKRLKVAVRRTTNGYSLVVVKGVEVKTEKYPRFFSFDFQPSQPEPEDVSIGVFSLSEKGEAVQAIVKDVSMRGNVPKNGWVLDYDLSIIDDV